MGIHEVGPWFRRKLCQTFMDSFKMGARLGVSHCTLDVVTWEIDNELGEIRAQFGEAMNKAMSNVEEEEIGTGGILFKGGAKAELPATMRVKEDLEFGGRNNVSCASGFAGLVENSTNRSVNLKRIALATEQGE